MGGQGGAHPALVLFTGGAPVNWLEASEQST
jgi:hypothetical protein